MKKMILLAIAAGLGLTGLVMADDATMPMPPPASKEFQQMKQLVGTWKGTEVGSSTENQEVTVEYKLTAGGSALAETLAAGTPHEMLTVYADEAGKLGMTHFCMLGNHPHMQLTKADAGELDFEVKRGSIGPKEQHMHSLALYFQDPDHLMQKWSCYANGKENKIATFKLVRVKPMPSSPAAAGNGSTTNSPPAAPGNGG